MHEKQFVVVMIQNSEYNTEDEEIAGDRRNGRHGTVLCLNEKNCLRQRTVPCLSSIVYSKEVKMSDSDMKKAIICMADGMEMCECLLTVDILRRAGVEVTTASVMEHIAVIASHQVKIYADAMIDDIDFDSADLLVLPGGRIGTENLGTSELIRKQCASFAASDEKYLAAVCAAPSVLADLGLLTGKTATCHPDFEDRVAAGGAALTHDSVTVCGNIITGQGLGATMDFALTLTEILTDKETADRIRKATCYRY